MTNTLGENTITTTNTYQTALKVTAPVFVLWDAGVCFAFREVGGVNAVKYRVQASNIDEEEEYITLLDDQLLAAGAADSETVGQPFLYTRVQVKSAVDSAEGTFKISACGF